MFPIVGEFRQCEHSYHHPHWPHSCDGCFCDDERDKAYNWPRPMEDA